MAKFKGKTQIIAILDRSGSMAPLERDTIGGYNRWLKDVKGASQGQDVVLTLHLFDTQHEFPQIAAKIEDVPKLDNATYYARGGTALLDAIGRSVNEINGLLGKKDRAICLIITDGYENSSQEYGPAAIAKLIKRCEKQGNWTFTYLGANQDAFTVAQSMGLSYGTTSQATQAGTRAVYRSAGAQTASTLSSGAMAGQTVSQADYDKALAEEEAKKAGA